MRIISGSARGRRLATPKDKRVRPTVDRVRESLFSILSDVRDLHVLDGFAGTGALGCEALSRGAASCFFVDAHPASIALVRENVSRVGADDRATIRRGPLHKTIPSITQSFDLIFLDPPYSKPELVKGAFDALALAACVHPETELVLEQEIDDALPTTSSFTCDDARTYGRTRLTFWSPVQEDDE